MKTLFPSVIVSFGLLCLFSFSSLEALEDKRLDYDDVKVVMRQIFDQHLTHKGMTDEILDESLEVYFTQFDPDKTYLLEREVRPFIDPSKRQMRRYLQSYFEENYDIFTEMNGVIGDSIKRARKWRNDVLFTDRKDQLFREAYRNPNPSWSDYANYTKGTSELVFRMRLDFIDYLRDQVNRYGQELVEARKEDVVKLYDKEKRAHENSYLFLTDEGQPLPADQREHLYVLHILKALAKSLDAHTSFLNLSEAYDMRARLQKGYVGVGIDFEQGLGGIVVTDLASGGPAEKDGRIQVNDLLVAIDGKATGPLSFNHAMDLLSGSRGSKTTLVFKRIEVEGGKENETLIPVQLKRELIEIDDGRVETSFVKTDSGLIGHITLHSFYQSPQGISSEQDVKRAIDELKKKGNLEGIVLDLRDNSGGYLMQAVKVAGLFITNGVVVISKYGDGQTRYYRDIDSSVSFDGPLVILTSRLTASAAEIVAQALQDYGVGIVVGDDHTYGKGSIQSQTVTDRESSSFYKVTVGTYYTVSGKTPQEKGVIADIVIPSPYSSDDHSFSSDSPAPLPILPSYEDKLLDVHPDIRGWYFKYYMPTLQKQRLDWKEHLQNLRAKSLLRTSRAATKESYAQNRDVQPGAGKDTQLEEAVSVVKDMIRIDQEHVASKKNLK